MFEPGNPLDIYDTTLRDGVQREGLNLSLEDKLKIAQRLDRLGVAYIEGGYPGSNPRDAEFFARAKELSWKHATIVAFGSSRYKGNRAEDDPNRCRHLSGDHRVQEQCGAGARCPRGFSR